MRTQFLALLLLPILVACSGDVSASDPVSQSVTYYVVRHAERESGDDPPLNAEGRARAERLADALERAGVDEIITTSFIRGQQTGQPLADRTGVPLTVAPAEPDWWPTLAGEVAAWQLDREAPGATYLMIGHATAYNTTLLEALGAPDRDVIVGEAYQDIVILIREPDGAVKLSILQYGGPSSLD